MKAVGLGLLGLIVFAIIKAFIKSIEKNKDEQYENIKTDQAELKTLIESQKHKHPLEEEFVNKCK